MEYLENYDVNEGNEFHGNLETKIFDNTQTITLYSYKNFFLVIFFLIHKLILILIFY